MASKLGSSAAPPRRPEPLMGWRFKKNDGKWLEKQLVITNRAYEEAGIARVEKVEPPTRWANGHPVPLRNPFVDFTGVTRGRSIHMEAKSTEKPSLSLLNEGGVTQRQWDMMIEWERHGAMCGVVWGYQGDLRFLSIATMRERLATGKKTMHWEEAEPISQGQGFILNDWLLNMRDSYGYPLTEPLLSRSK